MMNNKVIIYFIGLAAIGLVGVVIFLNKKKIKEYAYEFLNLFFKYRFNCFFITVGIIFFLFKIICTFYLFSNYCFLL